MVIYLSLKWCVLKRVLKPQGWTTARSAVAVSHDSKKTAVSARSARMAFRHSKK